MTFFNQNSFIFIHENVFENVVWEMSAILMLVKWDHVLPVTDGTLHSETSDSLMFTSIWRLCLAPTSITRFASDLGYRMA